MLYRHYLALVPVAFLAGCQSLGLGTGEDPDDISSAETRNGITTTAELDASIQRKGAGPWGRPFSLGSLQEDEPHEVEPDDYDDLWERLRSNFSMDLDIDNSRIESQRNWYARNQLYFNRTSERAKRYLEYIVSELEARDMPGELALLPIVESAFDPFAYSHGRASGIWQFIPSTGQAFGMEQDWWYDGRRDIISSTEGALRYLEQLAERFDGDYELALASYNAGWGRVARAIRANDSQGQDTDYWSLSALPRETRQYVPKLIALAQIVADPEKYGIVLPEVPNEPYFEVVDIGSQMDLAEAADMAELDVQEVYRLNPGYNRWATSPDGPHRLLVPKESAETFRSALAEVPPDQRISWRNYSVESGDTLIGIARRFNTTPDVIRESNDIQGHTIREGQDLLIPVAGQSGEFYALSEQKRRQARQSSGGGDSDQRVDYRVRSGDTLWDIASDHGVSVGQLASWNNMAPGDPIRAGDELAIWTSQESASSANSAPDRDGMVRRVGYTVRSGDSLNRIANRFNVGVADIARWNDVSTSDYLQPGQQLKLYVDIRNSP